MSQQTNIRTFWFLLAALLATSCARYNDLPYTLPKSKFDSLTTEQKRHYRESVRRCQEAGNGNAVAGICHLAIVEFDDFGEMWWPDQLKETLEVIDKYSYPPAIKRPGVGGAVVVVYVHGWKHDASPQNEESGNLSAFRNVLLRLTADERTKRGELARPVVGVYLAWSGLTAKTWLSKQISFFGRKEAAERVAGVSFSHAVHRIVGHAKGRAAAQRGNPHSVVAIIGHSFGGLILEETIMRSLTVETEGFTEFNPDLVILINSASEALRARQFIQALKDAPPRVLKMKDRCVSQPLIVSVTSAGDWATRNIFPVGMTLKSLFGRLRPRRSSVPGEAANIYDQWHYQTHTAGHLSFAGTLHSHEFHCPFAPGQICELAGSCDEAQGPLDFRIPAAILGECRRPAEAKRNGLECIDSLYFKGPRSHTIYSVERSPGSENDTGYWIMRTPPSVMPNHTGIFQDELGALLYALVHLKDARVVASRDEARNVIEKVFPTFQDLIRSSASAAPEICSERGAASLELASESGG